MNLSPHGGLDPLLDGQAYAQARALWIQQANDNPQNPIILGNAARFCLLHDRPTAEEFLKAA
ncbi:MAG TPA: hypothetical protein VNT26_12620 [Candidatus Sulfotelmatobacter sp.]|nr:hypothetical protein [Candidatus Sulfotelmatobacter sp.]